VATLTEANARLAKQSLLKKERTGRIGQHSFNPSSNNYYWKHGYKFANTHTILSCNFPMQGHKREATTADNMDGSQANK
jgi:hypothetical protein